jgi:erythromycin esterase
VGARPPGPRCPGGCPRDRRPPGQGTWRYGGSDAEIPSIGTRLADWYGADYVALSTTFGGGTFDPPNPVTGTTEIPAGAPDSVDLALDAVGGAPLLVDFRGRTAAPPPAGWLAERHPLRPMQNVAAPPRYAFPDAFDAVVFVDRVHSARPRG